MSKKINKYAKIAVLSMAFALLSFSFALAENQNKKNENALRNKELIKNVQERAKASVKNLEKAREEAKIELKKASEKAKEKIKGIRDEQKQKQAQQITKQFAKINETWTNHFNDLLAKYDATLLKIQTRADKAAADGKNVTDVNSAIQSAKTTISSARAAVADQAKKVYSINTAVTASSTVASTDAVDQEKLIKELRAQFKTVRNQLFKDLFALRDGVMKFSQDSVKSALKVLSKVPEVDKD